MPRVLYYVQHLWGLGHDRRAAAVREFMSEEPNIVLKPLRPDFPGVHGRADASISQAGYNTAMDVVTCGVPAVMVPYQGMGQAEQCLRAKPLADLDRVASGSE